MLRRRGGPRLEPARRSDAGHRLYAPQPRLPEEPTPAQLDAWIGLAELLAEPAFRRVERYRRLLGAINGWPPAPATVSAWEWLTAALRASA